MGYKQYSAYGSKILATLSQTLTWSHFFELVTIEDNNKRLFYQQMGIAEHWSVRQLRDKQDEMAYERSLIAEEELEDAIAKQLEAFILELGQGFAFLERQKRFTNVELSTVSK